MIRSLRLRFFLITWPLIVVTVAGVALAFDRWTEVRLTALEEVRAEPPRREGVDRAVDSLTRRWADGTSDAAVLGEAFGTIARRDSVGVVLVDARGGIAAASDARLRLRDRLDTLPGPGPQAFLQTTSAGGMVTQQMLQVAGRPVRDSTGAVRGMAFLVPIPAMRVTAPADLPPPPTTLRAEARRTLVVAVVVASAVAAALALLLAGPLVGQVSRLAGAAARVRAGDLGARVTVGSGDELGRMEQAFNAMAATLEVAETRQRNLVNDVAHELRTPLTNVVGILEAIEDGLRVPDPGTLGLLRSEAGLLAALVDDLQELSLAESGQLRYDLGPVDVGAEATAAIEAMRDAADGVRLTAPAARGVLATGDARRVRQVLRNLLRNAVTHTAAGGLVEILVETRGSEVGILVRDTGRGIPAAQLPLVWDRFHRVDPSRDRAGGGRGLGLAIVKQLVEGMGGRVAATSEEGRGSCFEVWLRG